MPTLRIAFAATTLTLLAPFATAQRQPLPGMPMVPPPVPHPALGAQPWFNGENEQSSTKTAPEPEMAPTPDKKQKPARPAVPPEETMGPKVEGQALKKAIGKVKSLKWFDNLSEARAHSAATGKPILWLQALGDIDGFA
jgi:hypothetical protein